LDDLGRCRLCRNGLTSFDALYCVGAYEGRLRHLIHLFKFDHMRQLDRPLGRFLRTGLPPDIQFDLLAPTPLHWTKRLSRGFNQADLLARELSRSTGIPVARLLRKTKSTEAQSTLSGPERRRNVKGAFRVKNAAQVSQKRILLVDDVYTTGATANACAKVLKDAGAHSVAVLTLARADRRVGTGPETALAVSQFV
jgi:ComF family protein